MVLERCQASKITLPVSQLSLFVSYVLILLKAHSTLHLKHTHTHTHTHTSIHPSIQQGISSQTLTYIYHGIHIKSSTHLPYISTITNPSMLLSKASHLIWHHIMVQVEHRHGNKQAYIISKAENKSWNNQTNMLLHLTIEGKRQTSKTHPCSSSK